METTDLKDIFIGYNKADKKWIYTLAAQMESETLDGTPGTRKLSVFLDKWNMDSYGGNPKSCIAGRRC
jgi:hypothetical protein